MQGSRDPGNEGRDQPPPQGEADHIGGDDHTDFIVKVAVEDLKAEDEDDLERDL